MNYKDSPHLVKIFDFDILHMELNTPLFILVLVLVVMFFMNKWLFRPVLRTLDNRAAHEKSLGDAVAGHRKEIDRLTAEYEASLVRVRGEVAQVRQDTHREIQQQVGAILEEARATAKGEFDTAMEALQGEVEQARRELGAKTQSLADQLTNRVYPA